MPGKMQLPLDEAELVTLQEMRDHHQLPYMRERATALLKVADGRSERDVARSGLLKPRWAGTIAEWVQRYKAQGVSGLSIRPGRGRKPVFSPRRPDS
jgi:transposase